MRRMSLLQNMAGMHDLRTRDADYDCRGKAGGMLPVRKERVSNERNVLIITFLSSVSSSAEKNNQLSILIIKTIVVPLRRNNVA